MTGKRTPMSDREKEKRQELLAVTREHCLDAGIDRFSVDKVATYAGISKRTIYRYFHSREELLAATITYDGDRWREWFFDFVCERAETSGDRLHAYLDALSLWHASEDYDGCLFVRALYTVPRPPESVVEAAQAQYKHLEKFLKDATGNLQTATAEVLVFALLQVTRPLLEGSLSPADDFVIDIIMQTVRDYLEKQGFHKADTVNTKKGRTKK